MTYQEAETFLFSELQSFQDKGRSAFNGTLDNALKLSELNGHPHQKFKSIHVAGTNGKGSVSHIIAAGLQANGYVVGVYTSPHYKTYRERIKINGEFISEQEVTEFIEASKNDILDIKPSFFEITCAMAFHHFAKHRVDIAVIEVGLGGRLDSTNIISPLLSVITNISFDHQNILGNTLAKIAAEKAGIIKSNTPILIGESQEEIKNVFVEKANEVEAPIHFADDMCSLSLTNPSKGEVSCETESKLWSMAFTSPLTSPFQLRNMKTALCALYLLREQFDLNPDKLTLGIEAIKKLTYFIGRWSVERTSPKVIFDSAHNLAGVTYLVEEVHKMDYESLRIVWGTTKEKEVDKILSILPKNAIYYFCQAQNSRAMDAEHLRIQANQNQLRGYAYTSVKAAYRLALTEANSNDLIIVAGSSFVIAELV